MPYSTLDIETYTHNNKLNVFCIVYKYRNKINYFKNDNSCVFLLFLKSLNETNYCFFVHNLTFDVLVLLDSINTNCYDIK